MSVFRNLLLALDGKKLPSEYQQVEWIAGTSTALNANSLDTGIKMQNNIEIIIGTSWNQSYGASYDRLAGFDTLGWLESMSNNTPLTLYPTGNYSGAFDTQRKEVKVTTTNWSVDGTVISTYTASAFGSTNITLLSNVTGAFTGGGRFSIWDCVIKVGSNILFDAVPCYRKSDNVIGIYDFVSKTFITKTGSGSFIKGGDV